MHMELHRLPTCQPWESQVSVHVAVHAGVELEPKVWVTVDVDAEKGTVSFRRCDALNSSL